MIRFVINSFFTLGLLGALVLFFAFNPFVEWRIRVAMQQTLDHPITFESIRLSPFTGTGDMGGVRVKGIDQFSEETLLHIPRISVKFSPFSVWSNTLIIKNITLHDTQIEYAGTLTQNNVLSMVQHLSSQKKPYPADENLMRPLYDKRYILKQASQTGTTVALQPGLLSHYNIQANVPDSSQEDPFSGEIITLNQVVSYMILDVLSRSPEAITGEFNTLKQGLVGLGLLHEDALKPPVEQKGFFSRAKDTFFSLFSPADVNP